MKHLFKFIKSDDPQIEDDMYELKSDNNIYIQINNGIYLVHKYYDAEGCCETFGDYKLLNDAMERALEIRYDDYQKIKGAVSTSIFREGLELATLLGRRYNTTKQGDK